MAAQLVTPKICQEYLGISEATYYRLLRADPPLPSIVLPVGGRRHRMSDVEDWINDLQAGQRPRRRRGRPRKAEQMARPGGVK